jgi:peptidoglycan/LPS O-acetylase OafA/YrhL
VAVTGITALSDPKGLVGIIQAVSTKQPVLQTLAITALTGSLMVLLVLPAVFGEAAGGLPRRLLAAPPVAWLGVISYGIFLWHLPTAELLANREDPQHFSATGLGLAERLPFTVTPLLIAMTLAATVVLAAMSYYLVERPAQRRAERR